MNTPFCQPPQSSSSSFSSSSSRGRITDLRSRTSTTAPETSEVTPQPRRSPWPIAIITFFCVAILGCGAFVAFCNRHPVDLVAADYYEQELRYQDQINREQRTREAAALSSITYDPTAKRVVIALPAAHAAAGATGKVQLYRPSAADQDRQLPLQIDENGAQTIEASGLQPGLWKVRVSWTVGGKDYYLDRNVTITSKPS